MSVPENYRTKSKLEVCVKAHDLCCYTLLRNHASKDNCFNCIRRMDAYYKSLWRQHFDGWHGVAAERNDNHLSGIITLLRLTTKRRITMQYTNSEIDTLISERIHNERNRRIMHLRLVDGLTHERIAEIVEMSPRQIKNIVKSCSKQIMPEQFVYTEICFS